KVAFLLVGKIDCERFDLHGARRSSCGHKRWRQRSWGRPPLNQPGPCEPGLDRAVRPASLLRKSILDVGRQASTTTGRTATYKLRATSISINYLCISICSETSLETMKQASLLLWK